MRCLLVQCGGMTMPIVCPRASRRLPIARPRLPARDGGMQCARGRVGVRAVWQEWLKTLARLQRTTANALGRTWQSVSLELACPALGGLTHRARHLAPALEDLRVDLAPVRSEVDDQARGDAPVAGDHAIGDLVPARHHGELVEDLVGQQRLGARAVAGLEAVAQLVAQAG